MTNPIKVFGHKSPDTDSVCSAIVWAWYLSTHKNEAAAPYLLGEPNTEALFVLDYWKQVKPELLGTLTASDRVAIVDTNNPQELPENVNEAIVEYLVDHHKLVGGLETLHPLDMTIRALACTTTVIYSIMTENERAGMPDFIAGLILSAIISDTLDLRSPTTTDTDKEVVFALGKKLGIDGKVYAQEMFAAKSDISHFSDAELLRLDSKKYEVGDQNFRVSVLETTLPQIVLDRQESLIQAMEEVAKEDGVDQVLLFIVDILKEESTLIIANDLVKTVAEKSFDVSVSGDTVVLPGVVSRKKQILPSLKI